MPITVTNPPQAQLPYTPEQIQQILSQGLDPTELKNAVANQVAQWIQAGAMSISFLNPVAGVLAAGASLFVNAELTRVIADYDAKLATVQSELAKFIPILHTQSNPWPEDVPAKTQTVSLDASVQKNGKMGVETAIITVPYDTVLDIRGEAGIQQTKAVGNNGASFLILGPQGPVFSWDHNSQITWQLLGYPPVDRFSILGQVPVQAGLYLAVAVPGVEDEGWVRVQISYAVPDLTQSIPPATNRSFLIFLAVGALFLLFQQQQQRRPTA